MSYIETMLAAVPAEHKDAYYRSAEKMAALFCNFGAIRVVESWGNTVPDGQLTSMPKAVDKQEGEVVISSIIFWPSKDIRDQAFEKMMNDPDVKAAMPMGLFDSKRMIFGGFDVMVDVGER